MWGKPHNLEALGKHLWITPTCVGKTRALKDGWCTIQGSPPRVWGKPPTSTDHTNRKPDHPHVCGENTIYSPYLIIIKYCAIYGGLNIQRTSFFIRFNPLFECEVVLIFSIRLEFLSTAALLLQLFSYLFLLPFAF